MVEDDWVVMKLNKTDRMESTCLISSLTVRGWGIEGGRRASAGQLFNDHSSDLFNNSRDEMDRELAKFFALKFQVDVNNGDISKIRFPTFEEVLGLTDLAILRKESFRNFDIENRATNSGRLRLIAQYLVVLVAKVLDDKLRGHAGFHRQLVSDVGSRIPTEIGLTLLRISQEALHKVLKLISIP